MRRALMLLSVFLLTACGGSQNASYLMGSGLHSLAVIRQQAFLASPWTTEVVVSRYPDCMRRHPLKGVASDRLKMDLYRVDAGVFIMNTGKRWYVAETQTCRFEQYKEPPPEPGELIGTFQVKDGLLMYLDKEMKNPAAAGAAAAPAGTNGVAPAPPVAGPTGMR